MSKNTFPKKPLFCVCLADALRQKKLSQAAYARSIKMSPGLVSKWLNGGIPTVEALPGSIAPFDVDTQRLLLRHWISEAFGEELLAIFEHTPAVMAESDDSLDAIAATLPSSTRQDVMTILKLAQRSQDVRDYLHSWVKIMSAK